MTLTATQASRNSPLVRSTGIHAQAERQMRTIGVGRGEDQQRQRDQHAQLDQRAAERRAHSSAVMAIAPQIRTGTLSMT